MESAPWRAAMKVSVKVIYHDYSSDSFTNWYFYFAEDVAFNSYEDSEYPITKVLRDPVYVDVQLLDRSDPKLVLTLGNCWVTADQSPHSFPRWDLLKDG